MVGLTLFALDQEHRLYWDGKPVKVQRRITFGFWEKVLAWIVALSTLAQGVAALLTWGAIKPPW
jgi:hypothetical protein